MSYAWIAIAGFVFGCACGKAWRLWRDRVIEEPNTDYMTDVTLEDEL